MKMAIFYTFQHKTAWELTKKRGYLAGNEKHISEEWFRKSYHWLIGQMNERIGHDNTFPVWMWDHLDLRKSFFKQQVSDEMVLLQVEVPSEKVLASDFDTWHIVLNDAYFPYNEEDEEDFYEKKTLRTEEEKIKSWEQIFDIEKCKKENNGELIIQYTTGKISINQIINVIEFENRKIKK